MEIQEVSSIQTICLNGRKFWRAFVPSEDCFKTFAESSSLSQLRASSEDFLLIADEDEKFLLFEKKGDLINQVHFDEPFMRPVFGKKDTGFFILVEMPEKNLLICEENIYECKSFNILGNNIFMANIVKNGEEKTLEAWYGYTKQLFYKIY